MKPAIWVRKLWRCIWKDWHPSSLEEIMKDAQNRDGVAALIAAPAVDVKSVRINVTMPADVLDQIDRYAEREGFTRSGFLAQAAKKAMAV
jgi:hypothetical protein